MLDTILSATFLIFLVLFTTSKLTNEDDYFLHLSTGRYVVENKSVPSEDIYSFQTQGVRWIPYEWLWSVTTFLIFSSFGYWGLSILNTLIFLVIFLSYFIIFRKFNVSYTIIFLFFTLLSFGIFERLTPRPHSASYLFFSLTLFILINYKYFKTDTIGQRQLFFLPLIFLFWANMHMGVIAGIAILTIFILSEIITYVKRKRFSSSKKSVSPAPLNKPEIVRVILIYAACLLVIPLNPQGLSTYSFAIGTMKMKTLEYINEYLSPFNPKFSGRFFIVIYMFFLFGGILILYYGKKQKDFFALILYSAFALNSLRALRFTVDFLVITFSYFVIAFNFLLIPSPEGKKGWVKDFINHKPHLKILVTAALVFFIFNIPNDKLYHSFLKYTRFSGVGLDSNYYPIKMFEFMKENKITDIGGRPFNTYECGGFFIWNFPGKKNFKDGRSVNDESMNEFQTIYSKLSGYEKKIRDYDFDYIIIAVPDIVSEPEIIQHSVISYFFKKPDEWKLIFWNDRSMLFVKNLPKFQEVISKYEYMFVNPYNFPFQRNVLDKAAAENKDLMRNEINRKIAEEPNGLIINTIARTYGNKLK